MTKIPLTKFIAQTGYCSRRQAESLIRGAKVLVNNKPAKLGQKVFYKDKVVVEGKRIEPIEKKYILLNKPRGYTCTSRKFKNEKNVYELLPPELQKQGLVIAGRLDKNSEGLLLLTNDGELVEKLTHPRYEHEKEYLVTIKNYELPITDLIKQFKTGIFFKPEKVKVKVKSIKHKGSNEFKIILAEGKKRQIRRMFEYCGIKVNSLKRVRIANYKLGKLKPGEYIKTRLTIDY